MKIIENAVIALALGFIGNGIASFVIHQGPVFMACVWMVGIALAPKLLKLPRKKVGSRRVAITGNIIVALMLGLVGNGVAAFMLRKGPIFMACIWLILITVIPKLLKMPSKREGYRTKIISFFKKDLFSARQEPAPVVSAAAVSPTTAKISNTVEEILRDVRSETEEIPTPSDEDFDDEFYDD